MKRIIAIFCILFVFLPAYACFTEISVKAAAKITSSEVVNASDSQSSGAPQATLEEDDAESDTDIWGSAIIKLRSSWLSLLILVLVLIALAVVVPYRRSLGVDHKEIK